MIELPSLDSIYDVADWVELVLASGEEDVVSKSLISNTIEALQGNEPPEAFISSVMLELRRRESLYSTPYYEVSSSLVRRLEGDSPLEYKALLLFALFGTRSASINAKLFERFTTFAVQGVFGAQSYCFGWPVLPDTPVAIADRLRVLCEKLNERFVESPAAKYKDRGVDVVFWLPHDGRSSQVVGLLQCAIGENWRGKTSGIPLTSWKQYIHWAAAPITAFAVPGVFPPDEEWHETSAEAGVLLDRPRLLRGTERSRLPSDFAEEIATWIETTLQEVAA
ncbi:MAG: hypothetical protein H4O13_07615 [Xanthomonadales bacterium]|nr:hypothetical protein [Xanthomonadales bacterium]